MEDEQTPAFFEALVSGRSLVKVLIEPATGRILDASRAAADFYGRSREELRQLSAWDLAPSRGREETLAVLEEVAAGRTPSPDSWNFLAGVEQRAVRVYPDLVESGDRVLVLATVLDWTGQREAETRQAARAQADDRARLRQMEERWKRALDAAGHGVWDWILPTGAVEYSPSWKRMLGYEADEIPGHADEWMRLIHPEDLEPTMAAVQAHLEGRTPGYECVHRLRCKDGTWKSVLTRGTVLERDEAGRPLRAIGTHHDVSAQKEAERQLRRSEERLRLATEGAELGVWYWDLSTLVLEWSDRCKEHLALPPGVSPNLERFYAAVHPEDRSRVEALIRGALEGRAEYRAEYRVVRADGTVRWISAPGRVFRSPDGVAVAMGGVTQDITARKEAEAALFASEQRMRVFIDHAPAALAVFDRDMRYLAASRRWRQDRGFGDRDLVGVCHYDVLPECSEEWRELHRRAMEGESFRTEDDRLDRADGTVQWLHREILPWHRLDGSIGGIMVFSEDITQRREAEQRLKRSEERLRLATEGAELGVWFWDLTCGKLEWSERCQAHMGMPLGKEPSVVGFYEAVHPEDRLRVSEQTREALEGGDDYRSEFRVLQPGGKLRWISTPGRVFRSPDGAAVAMGGVTQDITARKEAEAALFASEQQLRESEQRFRALNATLETKVQERTAELVAAQSRLQQALAEMALSEARYRTMFEQAPLGVALIDSLTGEIYAVNDRFAAIAGRTREEMEHIDWMQITHPDDVQEDLDNMGRLNAGEIPGFHMNKRYLWPDGTAVWISMTIAPLGREPGQGPRHLAMVEDITERRRLEQTLAESEARYRLAVDATSEALWDVDLRTGAQVVNHHWFTLLGYAPGDVEPTYGCFQERLHPDDVGRFHEAVEACLQNRVPRYEFEYRVVTKTGQLRWHRGVGKVVARDAGGTPVRMVGTFSDITLQRALEEELRAARQAADAASAAKTEFLAHMSHEIRTPLNGVLGLAQVLGRDALTANQRDLVARIQKAGRSLLVILNDVLDLSKIEAGQLRLESNPFDLEASLGMLESLVGDTARAKGLSLRIERPRGLLGSLVGDQMRLEQVLTNLLGNAIKFTSQGGVVVCVEAREVGEADLWLRFEVRDTGIGIAPETLTRLFTPFTQGDAATSRQYGGTGLGLSISRRLVELMGGEIGVDSQVGVGSTFWFEVPFGRALGPPEPSAEGVSRVKGPRLAGLHLLVVDDSPMNRDLMGRLLAVEGARATLAADGLEALRILKAQGREFDAVLMDLRMPVMDGVEATRRLRGELGLVDTCPSWS